MSSLGQGHGASPGAGLRQAAAPPRRPPPAAVNTRTRGSSAPPGATIASRSEPASLAAAGVDTARLAAGAAGGLRSWPSQRSSCPPAGGDPASPRKRSPKQVPSGAGSSPQPSPGNGGAGSRQQPLGTQQGSDPPTQTPTPPPPHRLAPLPTPAHPQDPLEPPGSPTAPLGCDPAEGSPSSAPLTRGPASRRQRAPLHTTSHTTSCPAAGGARRALHPPKGPRGRPSWGLPHAGAWWGRQSRGARHGSRLLQERRNRSRSSACPVPPPHSPRGSGTALAPRTPLASQPRGQPGHSSGQALPAQPGCRGGRFVGCVLQEGAENSYFLPKCQLPAQGSQPRAASSFLHHCCLRGAHQGSRAGTPAAVSPGAGAGHSLCPQRVSGAEPPPRPHRMGPQGPTQELSVGGDGVDSSVPPNSAHPLRHTEPTPGTPGCWQTAPHPP